jgi:hypothetical protein
MSDPIPLDIAGLLPSPGVYGRTLSGAGTGKILSAAEIRAAAEAYSAAQIDAALALRVPYTGANAAVNLGANALTCGAITTSGNLAIRNGLTPMQAELFGTYTSGTSFQSLCMKATASAMQIGSARGTSEANLPVQLGHFDSAGVFTSAISVASNGSVTLAALTHTFGYLAMTDSVTLAWPGSSFGTFRAGSNGCFRIDSKAAWYSSTTGVMQARNVGNTADIDIVCAAINLTALPTSDPGVAGRVWRDGTSLKISV